MSTFLLYSPLSWIPWQGTLFSYIVLSHHSACINTYVYIYYYYCSLKEDILVSVKISDLN